MLSEADRDEIIRSVEIANEVDISGVSIGFSVPSDVEILPFPPSGRSSTGASLDLADTSWSIIRSPSSIRTRIAW